MFKNGFVASVRVNGENLRELNNTVYLPLNSTYEIYLKNTTDKTACVTITVDDREIINDLIVYPMSSEIISRFYEGNAKSGHSLKFIKMTDKIAQHRGTTAFDGTLKVSWLYESKPVQTAPLSVQRLWREYPQYPSYPVNPITWTCTTSTFYSCADDNNSGAYLNINDIPTKNFSRRSVVNKGLDGITVNGAPVNQHISTVNNRWTWDYNEHVIELFMQGKEKKITTNPYKCATCGTVNKSVNKFCRECGTYLLDK